MNHSKPNRYQMESKQCACGAAPAIAKGLCKSCYNRQHARDHPRVGRRSLSTVCACGKPSLIVSTLECSACYNRRIDAEKRLFDQPSIPPHGGSRSFLFDRPESVAIEGNTR